MSRKRKPLFCVEVPTSGADRGATYGCSIKRAEAEAAIDRARARGFKMPVRIEERKTAPKGVRRDQWSTPFHRKGY